MDGLKIKTADGREWGSYSELAKATGLTLANLYYRNAIQVAPFTDKPFEGRKWGRRVYTTVDGRTFNSCAEVGKAFNMCDNTVRWRFTNNYYPFSDKCPKRSERPQTAVDGRVFPSLKAMERAYGLTYQTLLLRKRKQQFPFSNTRPKARGASVDFAALSAELGIPVEELRARKRQGAAPFGGNNFTPQQAAKEIITDDGRVWKTLSAAAEAFGIKRHAAYYRFKKGIYPFNLHGGEE